MNLSIIKNKAFRQTVVLYASVITAALVSIAVSAFNTRALGPEGYGDYRFLLNLFLMSITCLSMGVFVTGGRLIAIEEDRGAKREILGGQAVFIAIFAFIMGVIFFTISAEQERWFDNELGSVIVFMVPFLLMVPLDKALECVLKGDNRIYSLSFLRVSPGIIYLLTIYTVSFFTEIDLLVALCVFFASKIIVDVPIFIGMKPSFRNVARNIKVLIKNTKGYGFPIYTGMLAGTVTVQLAGITLALYVDTVAVGFFMLATTITSPITMVASTVGTVFFKSFSTAERIASKVMILTIVSMTLILSLFFFIIEDIILFVYTDKFIQVIDLVYVMAVGATLLGISELINNFVCAQGGGKMARNAAFARGAVNVLGFTVVVYKYGAYGAAVTTVLGAVAHLIVITYYYFQIVNHKTIK